MQLTEPDQLSHESYSAGWQTNGRADARIRQGQRRPPFPPLLC